MKFGIEGLTRKPIRRAFMTLEFDQLAVQYRPRHIHIQYAVERGSFLLQYDIVCTPYLK